MEENLHGLPDYPTAADCAVKFDSPSIARTGAPFDPTIQNPKSKIQNCLTVVGWFWHQKNGKRVYDPEDANIWAAMIDRHLSLPHRFVLMTDYPRERWDEFSNLIEPRELWSEFRDLKNPSWPANRPNCYVRLPAFSEKFGEILREVLRLTPDVPVRFVSIDLDCVPVGDLDPLFDRDEDFLIYHRPIEQRPRDEMNPYQASMWMMNTGARKKVYEEFKGDASIRAARQFIGTDQAWITKCLGPGEKGWSAADGVYSFYNVQRRLDWKKEEPPAGARIVFFQGGIKPRSLTEKAVSRPRCHQCGAEFDLKRYAQENAAAKYEYPWVAKHYRADGPSVERKALRSESDLDPQSLTLNASMRDLSTVETGLTAPRVERKALRSDLGPQSSTLNAMEGAA